MANNNTPTLRDAFIRKYPKSGALLNMWTLANHCPFEWEELTKVRLQTFVEYMSGKVSPNSARQYCARIKAVLNLYNEEVNLPKDYGKILSPRGVQTVNTWLTDEDLIKFANVQPISDNEKIVKNQFLIGAYCGARHSDYINFSEENIVKGMLVYVSQKTNIQATVPLKPIVAELLKSTPKVKLSEVTCNELLRKLCKRAGICQNVKVFRSGMESIGSKWQFVASHTARRSFATNLYLRGADLYSISKMLGHSSVEMTATNYICCGLKPQSPEVMAYFD